MMEKVWVIYRNEDNANEYVYEDRVYFSEKRANRIAKELSSKHSYDVWVDYLVIDYDLDLKYED